MHEEARAFGVSTKFLKSDIIAALERSQPFGLADRLRRLWRYMCLMIAVGDYVAVGEAVSVDGEYVAPGGSGAEVDWGGVILAGCVVARLVDLFVAATHSQK